MYTKIMKILILLAIFVSFPPIQTALADTGPKPTMDFQFTQAFPGDQVSIVSGTLFECEQNDCSDAEPLMEAGPQRLKCETSSCHAMAYGFKPYHRLEIEFSDGKMRQSNTFATAGFSSTYNVTIQPDDLLVESQFNPMGVLSPLFNLMLLCTACLLCLSVIVIVTFMLIIRREIKKQ